MDEEASSVVFDAFVDVPETAAASSGASASVEVLVMSGVEVELTKT